MDFGTLLSVAQKNEGSKQPIACYRTKFTPPKKESKQSKNLSENIKKFLARKEEEERRKAYEEKRKKENLLALRDHKTQSRINKHLKVCKSANKSVLADAIDNENTAVTMAGPSQPDEDDYGYVSQEASAFYNQLMNKYNNLPPEKPLFSDSGKRTVKDIASTKDRVKQALKQKELEDTLGHRRKRKSSSLTEKETEPDAKEKTSGDRDRDREKEKEKDKEEKPKVKKRPPAPPPIDFVQLLKLAEKKQHEPIVLEPKPKPKVEEPERLMTKKQMKEYLKEKEWREKKEQREKNPESAKVSTTTKAPPPQSGRIPKLSNGKTLPEKTEKPLTKSTTTSSVRKQSDKEKSSSLSTSNSKSSEKDLIQEERKKLEAVKKELEEIRRRIEEENKKKLELQSKLNKKSDASAPSATKSVSKTTKSSEKPTNSSKDVKPRQLPPVDVKRRPFPPQDIKSRQVPSSQDVKSRHFPPQDVKPKSFPANGKTRQFPPGDVRPVKRPFSHKDVRRAGPVHKRRIHDDEDEYDSELDDFIDDGPEEGAEDYSKYISEIFGYDKSKYRDYEDDDDAMESNFAQQLKEEYVSTKIGIMEDLEDIRMEALEKKRKAMLKKKSRK